MLEMMMGLSPIVTRWATVACKPDTASSATLARVPLGNAHDCAAQGTATQEVRRRATTTTESITSDAVPPWRRYPIFPLLLVLHELLCLRRESLSHGEP
jgi:hypothetical protein